jgi:hypothetical protein
MVERLMAIQRRNSAEGTLFGAIRFCACPLKQPG